jgi:phosphoribosyl 1,2-cyclic phosphodiesterase
MQIILTHEHADAVLGLDDIRAVQPYSATNDIDPTSIYLSQHAMERCLYLFFFFLFLIILFLDAHSRLMRPYPSLLVLTALDLSL